MSNFDPFNSASQSGGQQTYQQPPQQPEDSDGKTAKLYGIISIVLNVIGCCLPAGIILGILALLRVNASRRKLGYLSSDAHLGKVLGIVSIVWGALSFLFSMLYTVFVFLMPLLGAGGAGL